MAAMRMLKLVILLIGLTWLPGGLTLSLSAATSYTVESIPNTRLSDRLNHVSNPDGILVPADVTRINQILQVVEDSLGIEVAVVAVESIGDQDARMFATELFNHWGLGQKQRDNGLLIQLVTEPAQRSVVFETGYGIEDLLPDAICYRLQQRYMIADLKAGDYSAGMLKGVMAVSQYLLASDYERTKLSAPGSHLPDNGKLWIFGLVSAGMIGFAVFLSYLKYRPKICPRCGQKTFAYEGQLIVREATRFSEGLAEEVYRCKHCGFTKRTPRTINRIRPNGGGPIIMGGGGGFSGGGSSGSWGGGSSGGGGSISRF